MLTPAKQILKIRSGFVGIASFAAAGGASDNLTNALTTILASAGNGGASIPLQVGNATQEGVVTASGFNLCPVYGPSGRRLQDANGNDVYGKLTTSAGVWTVAYYSQPGGTETAFAMPAGTITIDVPIAFSFDHEPWYAGIVVTERHVAPDPALYGWRETNEAVAVTGANTLAALSNTPDGRKLHLIVNKLVYTLVDGDSPFTVSGKAITWNASNAGFALATSDLVTAVYTY